METKIKNRIGRFIVLILVIIVIILLLKKCCCCKCCEVTTTLPCPKDAKFPAGYNEPSRYTLMFLDYTDPSLMNDEAATKVRQTVKECLITPNDRVDIYAITPNTALNPTPLETYVLGIDGLETFIPYATSDSIIKSRRYFCNREKAIDSIEKTLSMFLSLQKKHADTIKYQNTDVAGLLYIADREFKNRPGNITKTLYIVSDMEQTYDGFFVLKNTRFNSKTKEHKGDPEKDFATISSSNSVSPDNFKNITLRFSKGGMDPGRDASIVQRDATKYWNRMFTLFSLKVNPSEFRTN